MTVLVLIVPSDKVTKAELETDDVTTTETTTKWKVVPPAVEQEEVEVKYEVPPVLVTIVVDVV